MKCKNINIVSGNYLQSKILIFSFTQQHIFKVYKVYIDVDYKNQLIFMLHANGFSIVFLEVFLAFVVKYHRIIY